MIEPTESESMHELDRFCDAMIAIRNEIREVENGRFAITDSPLRHAPHTVQIWPTKNGTANTHALKASSRKACRAPINTGAR